MFQRRSFRVLWLALIPVLVFPLYGQTSCNRNCPPSSDPCQRSAGRSIETGQCLYVGISGATCDYQGGAGICSEGQCLPNECTGVASYSICDNPLTGEPVGACMENLCVAAAPYDECVRVGVGRINCCSQQGCAVASGAYCTDPLDDGTPCDPTGVEPAGQPGQDGICDNGTCIAQTGPCAELACPTSAQDPCARKYCNPEPGQCEEWPIELYSNLGCFSAQGFDGVCAGGSCVPYEDPIRCGAVNGVGGEVCDDENPCTDNLCVNGSCTYPRLKDGAGCQDGESGQCFLGMCLPVFIPCSQDVDCEDGNPCTVNECEMSVLGNLCQSLTLDDDTPCLGDQGLCRNGVCLPNLCIGRDCDDGDSCTGDPITGGDICIPPYGICSSPEKPDGAPCENNGQCFNGVCQPTITPECDHEPFDPDRYFAECDDGNECTYDRCDFADQCTNPRKPNGTSCNNGNGQCIFGNCAITGF